jgi:hypothetical protein
MAKAAAPRTAESDPAASDDRLYAAPLSLEELQTRAERVRTLLTLVTECFGGVHCDMPMGALTCGQVMDLVDLARDELARICDRGD